MARGRRMRDGQDPAPQGLRPFGPRGGIGWLVDAQVHGMPGKTEARLASIGLTLQSAVRVDVPGEKRLP